MPDMLRADSCSVTVNLIHCARQRHYGALWYRRFALVLALNEYSLTYQDLNSSALARAFAVMWPAAGSAYVNRLMNTQKFSKIIGVPTIQAQIGIVSKIEEDVLIISKAEERVL